MTRKIGGAAIFACVLAALLATAAQASTVTESGSTLTYQAAPGESNDLEVSVTGGNYVIEDPAAAIAAGTGCTAAPPPAATTCTEAGITQLRIRVDDENDVVDLDSTVAVPAGIDLGDGDDLLFGDGSGGDDVQGGAGADHIDLGGGPAADVAHGGDGPDSISPDNGPDRLFGDGGDDTFSLSDDPGQEVFGGDGYDSLVIIPESAKARTSYTLDDVANDGDFAADVHSDVESLDAALVAVVEGIEGREPLTLVG